MPTDDLTDADEPEQTAAPAHVFAVRLWKEDLAGRSEYRGSVRDVMTDAFRGFRDFSDLVAFMVARLEQEQSARSRRAQGGR